MIGQTYIAQAMGGTFRKVFGIFSSERDAAARYLWTERCVLSVDALSYLLGGGAIW